MWCLIFIPTKAELKQVLLSTSSFLRIKDRPFHNDEYFTDFYASEKTDTNDVKKVARNYIQKLQNICDLYIFFKSPCRLTSSQTD